jgi:hypothetical protein
VTPLKPGVHDWGKTAGLSIDLDLNLAKNYNKPLSPTMNQLQHQNFGPPVGTVRPQGINFYAL